MPVARLLKRAEALQSPIYVGSAHEKTHGREASQMHCEYTRGTGSQLSGSPHTGGCQDSYHRSFVRLSGLNMMSSYPEWHGCVMALSVINAGVCETGF